MAIPTLLPEILNITNARTPKSCTAMVTTNTGGENINLKNIDLTTNVTVKTNER